MRMAWRRSLGGIAALLGVLAVLLSAIAPAAAHPTSDRHPVHAFAAAPDAPLPDCPHGDGKTCCPVSACPAVSMAYPVGTAFAVAWAGMAVAFTDPVAAGHAGLDAPPLTPPPRGRA